MEETDTTYDNMSFHDDSPGGYGGGGDTGSAHGGPIDIFMSPLKDIAKTAVWGTKYLGAAVSNAAMGLVTATIAGLLPYTDTEEGLGVSNAFRWFRENEKEQLEKIDSQYGDVLSRNEEAFKNHDLWGITFLLDPKTVIAGELLKAVPGAALDILDAFTAGAAKSILPTLTEDVAPDTVAKLLNNPEFLKKLDNSPAIQQLQANAAAMLVQRAQRVLSAKTLDDLSRATGKNVKPSLGNLEAQVNPAQRQGFEQGFLAQAKQTFKQEYLAGLNKMMQAQPGAAKPITAAIKQIQSMG